MVAWEGVSLDLADDIRIDRSGRASRYNSATPHCLWSPMEGVNLLLSSGNYYQLDCKHDSVAEHYRQLHPDWSTFKEWLRVYFNDLEADELDPERYPVYQSVIGILLEGGSVGQVQGDIWFEMTESLSNSFGERTLMNLWEEIDNHGFLEEQGDSAICGGRISR